MKHMKWPRKWTLKNFEKPTALLSFSNVNKEERKKINKFKDLRNKLNFKASKAITDMVIKNTNWESLGSHTHTKDKHTTNWATVENIRVPLFTRLNK
jgi:hypothetical protein